MSEEKKQDNTIDLISLIKALWLKRRLIIKTTIISGILGLAVAFIMPPSFRSFSTFVPQAGDSPVKGSLGGLASLAGINLSGLSGGSEFSPAIYPKVLGSVPFKMEILYTPLQWKDSTGTYKGYLLNKQQGLGPKLKKYTLGLPRLIKKAIVGKRPVTGNGNSNGLLRIDDLDFELFEQLDASIRIEVNEDDGYVTLSVFESNPIVAAQIATAVEKGLQKRLIDFKIESIRDLYEYANEQFSQKEKELYDIQDELAKFNDENQDISSALFQNKKLRLEADYNLLTSLYNEMAIQKERAALQLKKDTPIFAIINPVTVANKRATPNRPMILIMFVFLGIVLVTSYILTKERIVAIKKQITA